MARRVPKDKIFLSFVMIGISAILLISVFSNFTAMVSAKRQYNELVSEQKQLEKEKKSLNKEVNELKDDDYVVRYARDNYIFSKDGEKAVIIPK